MNGSRSAARMLILAGVVLSLSMGLFAQNKTRAERREEANSRSVTGTVAGADDKPLSGAVVQLKDMRTLQVRSFITLDDGKYHFFGLRADIDYQLIAKSDQMTASKTLSLFDNRKEAILNFKLSQK